MPTNPSRRFDHMEPGSTETSSSNKDSFRSGRSPFSKMSGEFGVEGGGSVLGSSDSGWGQQHRNSKTTEAEGSEKLGAEESPPARMSTESKQPPMMVPYSKLWAFATPLDYALMAIGAAAAVAHGAVLPVVLVLLARVVHSLGSNESNQDLAYQKICQISLILVYIAVASIFIAWLEVGCWMYTGERQAVRIRIRFLKALLSQNMAFFDAEISPEELVSRLSRDILLVHGAIGEKVGGFIFKFTIFAVGTLVAFLETWQVALLTFCTVPLLSGIGIIHGRICTSFLIRAHASTVKSGSIAGEAITHIQTVYALVGESRTVLAFSKALQTTAKLGMRSGLARGVGLGVSLGIMNFTWALALWYGGILIWKGKTNGGALLAAVFNIIFGGVALGQAIPDFQVFRQGRVAGFKVFEVINGQRGHLDISREILPTLRGEIEFHNVNFSYPSCPGVPLFSELSLTIHAGETVALVGSSGSGKSSLLLLLQRFYSPNSGEVTLDGKNIEELQLMWYRMQIGFVTQEPAVFSGTIRQNILYGRLDASEADVEAAAKEGNIHSFICKLPEGYETLVGGSGIQFSRGQKQQLAITRAILKKPAILLLDDATSGLDNQTEQMILESLRSAMQGRTIILVTHRLSTIRNADVIIVLDHGRLVEKGSHAQLLDQGDLSLYAQFVCLQETKDIGGDDVETSVMPSKVPTMPNSQEFKGSPSRSSLYSGTTSPVLSLLQSPVTPSTPNATPEAQSNSFPSSPLVFELPPSPATPVTQSAPFSRENSKSVAKCLLGKEQEVMKISSKLGFWSMCQIAASEWLSISLGSLAAAITGCLNPLLTLYLTDAIELFYTQEHNKNTRDKGNLWCVVVTGLGVVNIGSNIIQHFFYSKAGENASNSLCEKVFKAVMRNEVGWFDSLAPRSSMLTTRISYCGMRVKVAISEKVPICVQCFASLGVAITVAFTLQWKVAAVTMVLILFTAIGGFFKSRFLKKGFAGNLEKSHERATLLAAEAVLNIHTVAAYCLEQETLNHFRHELQAPLRQSALRAHKSGLLLGISQAGIHAANALCMWYLALQVKRRKADFGSALKVYQLLACMGYLLAGAFRLFPDIQRGVSATISLLEIANRKTAIDSEASEGQKLTSFAGRIELEHVTFSYPTRPTAVVLRDFNLTIPEGHTVALVGPSGCGKSTILRLLERFYDPGSGNVLVDGFNIQTLNLKWLRKHISLVQQEPVLFALSIRDNIQCGKENATEAEVMEAARKANAHGFISGLPRGYDTVVGQQPIQLSRGQQQRVAIARAVIRDPQIFLLDDATCTLDAQSEQVVQDALDNIMLEARRTTIVIAHRLASIQCADMIVFVNNGRIEEKGSHSTLLTMNGSYARLVRLQSWKLP